MKLLIQLKSLSSRLLHSELRVFYPLVTVAVVFMLFGYAGCKMPNDGIPIYLQVDSVSVSTTTGQGAGSHNIGDIWVEANTDNLAAYGLPANIPVLQENEVRFVINAGIKESGQSGIRVTYPFYRPDTFSITGVRGEVYHRSPVFRYREATVFALTENFDFSSGFSTDGVRTKIVDQSDGNVDPAFGGFRCLKLNVTSADSIAETASDPAIDLPEGQEIWLEVDYKSEVPFYIGFYGQGSGTTIKVPAMFVNPQASWNKVYVKLSLLIGQTRAPTYRIYFEALRPYATEGGNVYIDNVKLVHF